MSKQPNLIGCVFKDRYQIKKKLKSGGFGSVYLAKDTKEKNRFVAVKVIDLKSKFYAQIEIEMYEKIKQNCFTFGFIKHFDHGVENGSYFIVMELLDKDLDELVSKMKKQQFTLKTVLMIGLQVIDRLQAFHKIGYIHRDVKPDNLVIGFQEKKKIIYLIDFGLAKRIGQVRPEQKGKLLGSLGYMSCRAHQGKPTGTADDIQSLIYAMLYLLCGSLPWSRLKINTIAQTHKILMMKKKLSKFDFKQNVPQPLFQILNKIKSTSIDQKVDYLMIKYQFLDMLKSIKAQNDFIFDWDNIKPLATDKFDKNGPIQQEKLQRQKQKQENQKEIQKQIYQVYKFLDRNHYKRDQVKRQKKQLPQSVQNKLENKNNIQKKASQQRINKPQNKLQEKNIMKIRPSSVSNINKGKQPSKPKDLTLKMAQLYSTMKCVGPNIVINKTAKHKI